MLRLDIWEWKRYSQYPFSFIAENSGRKMTSIPELVPFPVSADFAFDLL